MTEPKIPPGQKKWERDFDLIEATMIEFFDDPKATQLLELLKQLRREHYRCAWLDEARRLHTESHAPNGDDDYARAQREQPFRAQFLKVIERH